MTRAHNTPRARTHSNAVYLQIKAATRRLMETVGGLAFAEAVTRVRKTKLSEYGLPQAAEVFIAADVIADLEAEAGEPIVTRELARIAGHCLIELPVVEEDENFIARLGLVSKDVGLVINRLAEALGDDGMVTAKEVRKLDLVALTDEAIEQLVCLRRAAVAVLAHEDAKGAER